MQPGWSVPDGLLGGGVVREPRPSDGKLTWQYRPAGHPVERLVAAVVARPVA